MNGVLIVDDDPAVRDLLTRWMSRAGYEVHQAANAESALETMGEVPVGVVLCDQAMPGRGGEWLVGQIREQFPQIAVILATGGDVPPRVSLQPGVVGFLSKPLSRELTLQAVADAMLWHRVASRGRPKPPASS